MNKWMPLGLLAVLAAAGCKTQGATPAEGLLGSGSTFVYPIMVQWGTEFEKQQRGCPVHYRSLGSGLGVANLISKKVDFGCTDAPMTDDELARAHAAGGEVLHIPLVLGAVVPAYNLPEANVPLKFTGDVLADIYLGKIKSWKDERIKKLNEGVDLPDREIIVVHRKDESGTTFIWTDYLSEVSPQWKEKLGKGTDVKWPVGVAENGNEGVARHIKETPYSLGYVQLSYVHQMDLASGLVKNRDGAYVKASLKSITAAGHNALKQIPVDLRFSLANAPGQDSFPICGATWAVVYANQPAGKETLVAFLHWVTTEGQDRVEPLFYARLPESLVDRAKQKIEQIKVGS